MLSGIRNHNNFAGLDGLRVIIDAISEKPSNIEQIKTYCCTQSLELALSFDSTVCLLSYVGLIELNYDDSLLSRKTASSGHNIHKRVLELLIEKMIADKAIQDLFHPLGVKYDVVLDKIAVRNSSISLSLSGIKKLLIAVGFFDKSGLSENLLIINPEYTDFFKEIILPAIMPERTNEDEGMSLDELRSILEKKQLYGKMAEEFVLKYERTRLSGHPKLEKVKIISDVDCGAGYDVISFENLNSAEINRFIEVKSYTGKTQFYWSKNEVEEAQARGDVYFLYLVNREKVSDSAYIPHIIQAPFKNVFLNELVWNREPQSWRFFQE
mgnify:CR=1 FL=1